MRLDLDTIYNWITPQSRVLDLGCGDGKLLARLRDGKQVSGYGLEIDSDEISRCIERGVNVIEQDMDKGLGNFADNSFDTVVMTQAIQSLHYPHLVLEEMLRVGKQCIVTFPNFGHWKARCHLALRGRMPVSDLLPFEWYNTPNIHFCTFKDFEILCHERDISLSQRLVVSESKPDSFFKDLIPNLFGEIAIYQLTR